VHDPGVVDEHVEGAELRLDRVEEARERAPVGHVERERDGAAAELRRGPPRELQVEVAERDARAGQAITNLLTA